MSIETLTREVAELRRRVDLAENKLAQQSGQFEFISSQLRDVQLYMHARFADMDDRFGKLEGRLDGVDARLDRVDDRLDRADSRAERVEGKIDALPRVIAEIIARGSGGHASFCRSSSRYAAAPLPFFAAPQPDPLPVSRAREEAK